MTDLCVLLSRSLLCASLAVLPLAAQTPDGPYWSSYPIPPGVTRTQLLGSSFVAQTTNAIHVYSSIHRAWTVIPVVAGATVTTTNDYSIVQDGTTFHAWSARTNTVETLNAPPGSTLSVGSATSSWCCFVRSGSTFYAYSAFLGRWEPTLLLGSLQYTGVGSHALCIADDTEVRAFSAFHGTWVIEPNLPGSVFYTGRNAIVMASGQPDTVKAFSAYSNSWASTPFPGATSAVVVALDGHTLVYTGGGSDLLAFGALHATWSRLTSTGQVAIDNGPNVTIVRTATAGFGYSPGIDAFVPLPFRPTNVQVAGGSFGAYAICDDGAATAVAFSGLTGVVTSAPILDTFYWSLGDTAALGVGATGVCFAYSALHDRWEVLPDTNPGLLRPSYEAVFAETAGGTWAFSARRCTWSLLPVMGTATVHQPAGALLGVLESDKVHVYDPVLGRWNSTSTSNPPQFHVWRLTGIAHDGMAAHGYCLFTNVWESVPLTGPVVNYRAQDLVGYVETTTHYQMFSANGSLTNFSRFPEFSRFCVRGAPLQHVQQGEPGSFVVGLFAFDDLEQPMPPYGILRVDQQAAIAVTMGVIGANGLLRSPIQIPNHSSWHGMRLAMQDVVFTPQGRVLLTNAQVPYLW